MDRWMDGQTNRQKNGQTDKYKGGQTNIWMDMLYKCIEMQKTMIFQFLQTQNRLTNGPTNGPINGPTSGPTNGPTDGRTYPLKEMRHLKLNDKMTKLLQENMIRESLIVKTTSFYAIIKLHFCLKDLFCTE